MLNQTTGNKEIKDFNYSNHSKGTMINVNVNNPKASERIVKVEKKKK